MRVGQRIVHFKGRRRDCFRCLYLYAVNSNPAPGFCDSNLMRSGGQQHAPHQGIGVSICGAVKSSCKFSVNNDIICLSAAIAFCVNHNVVCSVRRNLYCKFKRIRVCSKVSGSLSTGTSGLLNCLHIASHDCVLRFVNADRFRRTGERYRRNSNGCQDCGCEHSFFHNVPPFFSS